MNKINKKTLVNWISGHIRWLEDLKNSSNPNKEGWLDTANYELKALCHFLPHGSGIDGPSGRRQLLDDSTPQKLRFCSDFHHMNEGGFYDGWTEHTVTVTPEFGDINIKISGRNRNEIKDYLFDTWVYDLTRVYEKTPEGFVLVER